LIFLNDFKIRSSGRYILGISIYPLGMKYPTPFYVLSHEKNTPTARSQHGPVSGRLRNHVLPQW